MQIFFVCVTSSLLGVTRGDFSLMIYTRDSGLDDNIQFLHWLQPKTPLISCLAHSLMTRVPRHTWVKFVHCFSSSSPLESNHIRLLFLLGNLKAFGFLGGLCEQGHCMIDLRHESIVMLGLTSRASARKTGLVDQLLYNPILYWMSLNS